MLRAVFTALAAAALLAAWGTDLTAQRRPRRPVYVDRGACEGEACGYGRWRSEMGAVALFARPVARSRRVGQLRPGTCVTALTGEVHVYAPGRFVVRKAQGRYRPGDVILAYTYLGEEVYKVRHRGRWIQEEQLSFSPEPGPSAAGSCDLDPRCWGVFERKPDSDWWVKMRDDAGLVGWTREPGNFEQPYWLSASDCPPRRRGAGRAPGATP